MNDRALAAAALRNAVPYLRLFQGRVFVVKIGGEAFENHSQLHELLEQIAILHRLGIRVVLVHGGGPQISHVSGQLGLEPKIIEGRRVTCDRTLEATAMALNGSINTRLVAAFRDFKIPAVGVSGVDGELEGIDRTEVFVLPLLHDAVSPCSILKELQFRFVLRRFLYLAKKVL